MKERVQEIVLLRGMAIIAIVILHVSAFFLNINQAMHLSFKASFILNQLARFSLPVFLIISGFGLAYNYDNTDKNWHLNFLKKRVNVVLGPYLAWSLLYFVFYLMILKKIPSEGVVLDFSPGSLAWSQVFRIFLKNLFFGWNYVHLYFIVLILQFYFLYPLIIKRLYKSQHKGLVLLVTFVTYLFLMIYIFYFRKLTGNYYFDIFIRYYWEMFIAWYFYFVFGLVIGLEAEQFRVISTRYFYIIGFCYFCTAGWVVMDALAYLPDQIGRLTSLRVTVLFNTVFAFPFYFKLCRIIQETMPRPANWLAEIGNISFGIYFVHLLFIVIFSKIMNNIAPDLFSFNRASFIFWLFLITLLGSIIFVRIINRFTYGRLLSGQSTPQTIFRQNISQ